MLQAMRLDPSSLALQGRRIRQTHIYYERDWRRTLRHYVFSASRHLTPMMVVGDGGIRYLITTSDHVSRHIYVHHNYEGPMMAESIRIIGDILNERDFLSGKVFIDVGANLGTSTIPAIRGFHASRVVAFEPAPDNYDILRCNLLLNRVDTLVDTYAVAISDYDGEALLELADESTGDHRVRVAGPFADQEAFREQFRATVTVPAARLDSFVDRGQIDVATVGLLWVDVQGHEAQVLAGGSSMLGRQRHLPVVIEFWPYGLRRAGGLAKLCELIAMHYDLVIDVRATHREGGVVKIPASDVLRLADVYPGISFTDLILLR